VLSAESADIKFLHSVTQVGARQTPQLAASVVIPFSDHSSSRMQQGYSSNK
jgi:hypothetical protein